MFDDRQDVRQFLTFLAREVRRGTLEVHCFTVLTNHYHALVRSLGGELSPSMQRVGLGHSRHYNRHHRRDGPVLRGRYFSKRVRSLQYRCAVVRYIDANPVKAGLATHPWDYPFGSAASYVHGRIPPWLTTTWIESEVMRPTGWEGVGDLRPYNAQGYIQRFGGAYGPYAAELVERRLAMGDSGPDDLDSLVGAAPPRVLAWMQRKARLADGGRVGEPVVVQLAVDASIDAWPSSLDEVVNESGGRRICSKLVVRVGLLRSMAALTWSEIARVTNLPESTCRRYYEKHRRLVLHETFYAAASSASAQRAIGITFGVTIEDRGV